MMKIRRREFVTGLLATSLAAPAWIRAQSPGRKPRLLIAEEDPFTGLALLRTRYASGLRPSDDMLGWTLSWQLTGKDSFADRALTEMRASGLPTGGRASRNWLDYTRWSLAFDWLFGHPDFDSALKDRVANQLVEGAVKILARPELSRPRQISYQNYPVRYLTLAAFPLAAVKGYADFDRRCEPLRDQVQQGLLNIFQQTEFVTPKGSYHESMDYMRITWASLLLMVELQRTTTGVDPARRYSLFRNIGETYLYKLMPNGTPSREGDNEYPLLDTRDTAVIGYAVNRFKDPYSAWLLRSSGFFVKDWVLPILKFLWDDPEVIPQSPALSSESDLPRQRYFPGVGHLVMRDGWKPDSTWIEFDCGPYFAKHQHLDQNQLTIYRNGYLAIDSGADYTESESPHYLNYYRRTVAHNSMLVYDPSEKFFWSSDVLAAANDGGQRMNSSRYWNTIRSIEDWNNTRDIWNLGCMRVIDHVPQQYHYALGDATNAYIDRKLSRFTREVVYIPEGNLLFVFDRVKSTDPNLYKAWLLHGVNRPSVDGNVGSDTQGVSNFPDAKTFVFDEGSGELRVHSLLPSQRNITRRGGPGNEFYTPGNDHGGAWGSGQNWPLDPANGGPLPTDPKLLHMWKTFWGQDYDRIERSNRKNVVPGAWRIEVSPTVPANEDLFLHVFEIGDSGTTGGKRVELVNGANFAGAAFEQGPIVLFSDAASKLDEGEAYLPDLACNFLLITSLVPDAMYELNFTGLNVSTSASAVPPGAPAQLLRLRANEHGVLRVDVRQLGNLSLHIERI
jgi:Heparinase II/III-like protein